MAKNKDPALPPFEGFAPEGVSWFHALAMNQNREWFQANRAAYEVLWLTPMKSLLAELRAPLEKLYGAKLLKPAKLFRLNRDVRFSNDKTPYKTNTSGMFGLGASQGQSGPVALYCQLGLEEFAGAGAYAMMPESLARFRRRVLDEKTGPALEKLVRAASAKGLEPTAVQVLKRAPPGVPVDHPRIALLKHKGLALGVEAIPKKVRYTRALKPWLLEQAAAAAPVVKWLLAQKLY